MRKKLCCLLLCLLTLAGGGTASLAQAAEGELSMVLTATEDEIVVDVTGAPAGARLVRFHPNEYHSSEDFLAEYDGVGNDCTTDGYDTDRNYYSRNVAGVIEAEGVSGSTTIKINRFEEGGYDKVYDKFYLVTGGSAASGKLSGGEVAIGPRYVTALPSARNYARTEKTSIKGLEVFMADDAERLGISHSGITVSLNELFATERTPAAKRIEHVANGETFYYNKEYIGRLDQQVKELTDANIEITFVLVIWGPYRNQMPANLYHQDYENVTALDCVAPNMTDWDAVKTWIAAYEFLGDRYTREDGLYGHVNNFTVGNELSSAWSWHNMGKLPIEEFVRQYERYLRIAHTALTKAWSGVNVMVSLDNYWTVDSATEFGLGAWIGKGGFRGRDLLDRFAATTREMGDFDWNIAYHPYGLDLRNPIFWDDKTLRESPKSVDAHRLTPWNIEILPQYLDLEKMKVNGTVKRSFYFTEQGYASPHEDNWQNYNPDTYDPDNLPKEWLDRQCAAYAFAQYKFFFIGAKANINHRQFDVKSQGGNLGIWSREDNGSDFAPYKPKPVHEVMKYIDTERSLEVTTPYLHLLTFNGKTPKSWGDIIENFDESKLAVRKSVSAQNATVSETSSISQSLGSFEDRSLDGWEASVNVNSVNAVKSASAAFAGNGYLSAAYIEDNYTAGGQSDKGIMRKFEEPLDLTKAESFQAAVKVSARNQSKVKYTVSIRFYAGDKVCEAQAEVQPDVWQVVSVNLKELDFEGKDRVDMIKIWYHTDQTARQDGRILFDEIGLGGTNNASGCQSGCAGGTAGTGVGLLSLAAVGMLFFKWRR